MPSPTILVLEVSLARTSPLVWRIIEIPLSQTLHDLHKAIQVAMGWTNSHLYSFVKETPTDRIEFMLPEYDDNPETEVINDPRNFKLRNMFPENGDSIEYIYDFGDHWQHSVVRKGVKRSSSIFGYPACPAGVRTCPPEDIGGISGYNQLLIAIANKDKRALRKYREWLGFDYDPDGFNAERLTFMSKSVKKIKP